MIFWASLFLNYTMKSVKEWRFEGDDYRIRWNCEVMRTSVFTVSNNIQLILKIAILNLRLFLF
jgi:hypothetical protein